MCKKLVYLAGPIAKLTYGDSVSWRDYVTMNLSKFNIETLSPMRGKKYLKDEIHVQDSYENFPMSSRKGITTRDRFDVMRCDLVLANFMPSENVSIGTVIEMGWADAWRKPVVAVLNNSNIHYHAMIREIVGFVVPNLDDAIEIIKNLVE